MVLGSFQALVMGCSTRNGKIIPIGQRVRKLWANGILKAHSIQLELTGPGAELIQGLESTIIVMNHQSALDIYVNVAMLEERFFFFAKRELLKIPIFGYAAWLSGVVFVDRAKGVNDTQALDSIKKALANKNNILIYPEGTRSENGQLREFKRGAFVVAIGAQANVLPVTILNSWELLPKHGHSLKTGTVKLHIDMPISTKGMDVSQRRELADRVRGIMAKNLENYTKARDNT